jgi:hypothetical protein
MSSLSPEASLSWALAESWKMHKNTRQHSTGDRNLLGMLWRSFCLYMNNATGGIPTPHDSLVAVLRNAVMPQWHNFQSSNL